MADWEYLFPPEVMKELRGYVDQATALANEEPYKTRVGWVREGFLVPQERAAARYLEQKTRRPAQRPREGVCYRLKAAPAVDGDGGDAAWTRLPRFFLNDWRSGAKPKAATWFRMGYDDTALYFLVRCEDPTAAKIRANCRDRDGDVYLDDCIEVHLTFDRTKSQRYQILVNSRGVVQDFAHLLNEAGVDVPNLKWDCDGLVAAAKTDAQGFTVELSLPLAKVGGASEAGALFWANVCREKYSGGEGTQPQELQSWSATQTGFDDGKYFSRIVMTAGDGWSLFGDEQTPPPPPVLYKVDANNPWVLTPEAIQAVAEQDRVRYLMKCPKVDEKGRTYGGFGVKLDPPVDAAAYPWAEVVFTKPNRDVMLELIYNYTAADGKDYSNYFLPSTFGEGSRTPQVFAKRLAEGWEADRPAPRLLKSVTVYGVVEGAKTPLECDFSVQWIRLCRDTLQGPQP